MFTREDWIKALMEIDFTREEAIKLLESPDGEESDEIHLAALKRVVG